MWEQTTIRKSTCRHSKCWRLPPQEREARQAPAMTMTKRPSSSVDTLRYGSQYSRRQSGPTSAGWRKVFVRSRSSRKIISSSGCSRSRSSAKARTLPSRKAALYPSQPSPPPVRFYLIQPCSTDLIPSPAVERISLTHSLLQGSDSLNEIQMRLRKQLASFGLNMTASSSDNWRPVSHEKSKPSSSKNKDTSIIQDENSGDRLNFACENPKTTFYNKRQ